MNGWAFLHSFTKTEKADPAMLATFIDAVLGACGDAIVWVAAETHSKQRMYRRLGFMDTDKKMNGRPVMVRVPMKGSVN